MLFDNISFFFWKISAIALFLAVIIYPVSFSKDLDKGKQISFLQRHKKIISFKTNFEQLTQIKTYFLCSRDLLKTRNRYKS